MCRRMLTRRANQRTNSRTGGTLLLPEYRSMAGGLDVRLTVAALMRLEECAIRIEPFPREEGGGILVTVPDLPGCVAGGETIEAATARWSAPAW